MKRLMLSLAVLALAGAQQPTFPQPTFPQPIRQQRDRYFARYPFERWRAAGDHAQIQWSAQLTPARLSVHQRLATFIVIRIEAKEVGTRRGRGEFATLVEIEDAAGHSWRIHNAFDLAKIPATAKIYPVQYSQEVFLTPGDYRIHMATVDSATGDYSFTTRPLHVDPVKNDRLAQAGRDLPTVEFVRPLEPPDGWFQPNVHGRLRLEARTSRPVSVDILVNLTPSERGASLVRQFRRNMSLIVPALKILSGIEFNGTVNVTLLDLARQKIWRQTDVRALDWATLREPFAGTQPGLIDAQSLALKSQMAAFLSAEIEQRLGPGDSPRVVIVLSAPLFWDHQDRAEPAAGTRDAAQRLYYVRYRPLPTGRAPSGTPPDDLEQLLKKREAKLLSASSPGEFRRVLAALLADIQKL